MKTLFSMFAVAGVLLFLSCSKEKSPDNTPVQRPEFSNNEPLSLSVRVMNGHPDVTIEKLFVNDQLVDLPQGLVNSAIPAGKHTLKVVAQGTNAGSIIVTDSQGTAFCRNLGSGEISEISFDGITMNTANAVVITYSPKACQNL